MTATMVVSAPADDWAWLACTEPGCRWSCPVDQGNRLWSHAAVAHLRRPTPAERTPVVPMPSSSSGVPSDDLLISVARRAVDSDGRVWCVVFGEHYGLTRHEGAWWYARRPVNGSPIRYMARVESRDSLVALDRWDLATCPADTDPTPVSLPRLVPSLIALAGGGW